MFQEQYIQKIRFIRNVFILLLASLYSLSSFSQTGHRSVTGQLADSTSNESILDASVQIRSLKDTAHQYFTRSSSNGSFQINNLDTGDYIINVSHQGYEDLKKFVTIAAQDSLINLGKFKLQQAYKVLAEVIVKDAAPMKVNGDTIAYRADAFKTRKNATVEDLLKKLPGVQVDRSGAVKAQGEQVQKVYVDGKEFFSNDPHLATKNLTADMIDQVQVYNDVSEQSKFSGIDDGSRTKTINLKLKKDKKSGLIGQASAGYGTDKRYATGFGLNFFKGASRISLIAGANNINNLSITPGEMSGLAGGKSFNSSGIGSGSNGIGNASIIGLNYQDSWGKNIDVSGSYVFNNSTLSNTTNTERQTFLIDSTILTNGESVYANSKKSHQLNLNLKYSIDSFNSIIYTTNNLIQQLQLINSNSITNYIEKQNVPYKASENKSSNQSAGMLYNQVNNLIWRRRFKRPGQTFSINLSSVSNKNESQINNVNSSNFYNKEGLLYQQRNTNFKVDNTNPNNNYGISAAYTEPISTNKVLALNFSYNKNNNNSDRKTHNYNPATKAYDQLIDSLSNNFNNTNTYKRYGAALKAWNAKYNFQIGFAIQDALLERNDPGKSIHLAQRYLNLLPNASLNYRFAKNKNFQISYRGQNNLPNIMQLQNTTDVTNYPYVVKGNPELQPEFVNSIILTYNAFNPLNFQNLFINVIYGNTQNKISNSIQTNGVEQTYTPVNLNGAYYVSGSVNYGLPVKRIVGSNINFTTNMDYNRNATLINSFKNYTKDVSVGEELSFNYAHNDKLDAQINAGIIYNSAQYSNQVAQNTSYFTHNYGLDVSYSFPKDITMLTSVNYQFYTGKANSFNKDALLWNASLSKQLFKNRRGELKISVNDILNKNLNIYRNTAENFFESVRYTTLKRFALLTFIYKINQPITTHNKKNE